MHRRILATAMAGLLSAGSAHIIHEKPDTDCPQGEVHDCAGGGRATCGIIEGDDR